MLATGVGHLLSSIGVLFMLGLTMAFSPTVFGIEIGAVRQSKLPGLTVAVIAGAVAVASTLLTVLLLAVSPNTLHTLWTGEVETIVSQRWLDAAVGAALVVAGTVQWRRAARPRRVSPTSRLLDRPQVLFPVVLANSLLSTSSPATMYLVVRTINTTRPGLWLVEYLVFLVGLALPYVILAVAVTRIPAFAHRVSEAIAALSRRDLRRPIAVIIIVVGAALLAWSGVTLVSTS